jgi:Na+/H+ antiporter NhaC
MPDHPFGWWSLVPPVAAIVLAIATRRVVLSLAAGVLAGALILAGGNPLRAVPAMFEDHLWTNLIDESHLRVFVFTTLMGAMVGVIYRSGGMHGVVEKLAPLARNRRGGQLTTWLLGLVIFFDDYANTLLLGTTMRPLADRLRISREKLAYLVDSTAAPVSGLALISTWIAGEISYIEDGLAGLTFTESTDGFRLFVESIPYRFYVVWALLFVPLVALFGRDFGPMLAAERRSLRGETVTSNPASEDAASREREKPLPGRWWNAALPVAITIAVTLWLLTATGSAALEEEAAQQGADVERSIMTIIGSGDSYLALVYASLSGLAAAVLLARGEAILSWAEIRRAALEGARHMAPALAILWLAWSLSGVTKAEHLATGSFLGDLLREHVSLHWAPTMIFVLASIVAFCTGTSWGTMSILTPLVIQVMHAMLSAGGEPVDPHHPLFIGAVGSVLAGAIFGDHCSPISDTTVLSSMASGCHHVDHVRTQLPYAMIVAAASVLLGTVPLAFGLSVWLLLPIGLVALAISLLLIGRRAENGAPVSRIIRNGARNH